MWHIVKVTLGHSVQKLTLHPFSKLPRVESSVESLTNEMLNYNCFQDLIIDAIYADIIHGKLDQKNKQVCLQTQ